MAARVNRPLEVAAFSANGIARLRREFREQLQGLHTDVPPLSETLLKPHETFFILNYHIYQTASQAEKVELLLQLEKAFPTTM
jgi:hypothetical protein